ncbi:hypothetical protein [Nocardiopsis metallicus]|uniref:Uncharacterized protein n=1 Tax=Nocardiopsis metallicus TaxID=179819 RepID=A0A840WRP5_9ACTN|nr:hypothetical protein [Nocardiopsis metallicus]MBB5494575.1 hypothetical protein [Nocardiopsis metallicus]
MVLASRGWLVSASRAARNPRGAYARLLILSGIVAVAWLAGGVGVAHGETSTESGGLGNLGGSVLGVGEITDRTGQAAGELRETRLSDTATRAASSTGALTETVVPQASALPANALRETGVSAALEESTVGSVANEIVHDTGQAVDDTARGATGLVTGVARTGQEVVESTDGSLRENALVDTVTSGLADTVGQGGTDAVTENGGPLGLPVLGSAEDSAFATLPADQRPDADADEREREEREREERDARVARAADEIAAHVVENSWRVADEAARKAGDTAAGGESAERIRLIGGGSYHQAGPDTTGASAPSFQAPGAAGFLMARSEHMVLRAQRVALPGDPNLVVRDAADDPSFSPD